MRPNDFQRAGWVWALWLEALWLAVPASARIRGAVRLLRGGGEFRCR